MMETASPSRLLEDQHRRIDQGLQDIIDGAGSLARLSESLALLCLHLYAEEEILFPPLEASGLTMPVFVMKREHGQMWPLVQDLTAACGSAGPVDTLQNDCRELLQLLQIHNPKEEQILYAAADRLAADPDHGSLAQALEAARLPHGWACAMAPR
ncbi:MAG: hemerythrin domain-containing protein [Proteobacteria bacterium]|nr:hemerythrin domain-containing protein [Pseudomonadota bacterium]